MTRTPDAVLADLLTASEAVLGALAGNDDWSLVARDHGGQYGHDIVADEAACAALHGLGYEVLSEESGRSGQGDVLVVVDPVDGSTNAGLGIPHWVTSLCAVDDDGPLASVVRNPANGETFTAIRGAGAWLDGRELSVVAPPSTAKAVVGVTGLPASRLPVWQFRAMGAAALDLCYVGAGRLHGFLAPSGLSVWDYLGALLVCTEAGAVAVDARDRDLVAIHGDHRRSPVVASTDELLAALQAVVR